ncbi:GntR family transcriptional regulator [Bacillus sp. 2205SS5-2]|uniref:GntR family transcriptional regulator n=1 Tax=Bacillus sp. 2205SS5-2 TaxID=3109031 RepID=UPI00300634E3
MFDIDIRSRKPIYEQLVDKIKEFIISGVLTPDEKLPSVRHLSKELTVNPNTIQKAYRELEREGYLYSQPGKGSFVAPLPDSLQQRKLQLVKKELLKLISEAIFLGLTEIELLEIYTTVISSHPKGEQL